MPYKKRKTRRPRGPRRKRRRRRAVNVALGGTPLPKSFKTRLRYSEAVTLNPGTGGSASVNIMAANGLYDPNLTGVGHQPRGWDEIIPLYNHATVIGSRCTVEFINRDGAASQLVGIALRPSTTSEVDPNNYTEGQCVKYALLNATGGLDSKTMTYSFNNRFLGISSPMSTALVRNSSSANPTELATYHIFAANPYGTDSGAVECLVTIEYVVVFTEPKTPTQS